MNCFFATHKHSLNFKYKWINTIEIKLCTLIHSALIYKYRLQWIFVQRWNRTHTIRNMLDFKCRKLWVWIESTYPFEYSLLISDAHIFRHYNPLFRITTWYSGRVSLPKLYGSQANEYCFVTKYFSLFWWLHYTHHVPPCQYG